ncbi:FG-GAP repeat domain-containing protein [Gimesia maris]|uniref:FG-GAP repeat domain-containing protein n=1 Tax=Gimesia maris TaxID=122 RepID=UPI00241FF14A|nr:VCBS repeat-containing protein [Gimesia maris]|tara:strand:- start:173453 stop:175783 length:2331 start_codon:yes stop_codon:yes gene_type:complete
MLIGSSKSIRMLCLTMLAVYCIAGAQPPVYADDKVKLGDSYGFKPLELFKLSDRSANMLAQDLNGDGLNDLILIDNSNSRIDVLQQRAPGEKVSPDEMTDEVNGIPSDARLKHIKIPVDVSISALTVGDFNGDGLNDLAYLALPDRLIIRYQTKTGEWSDRKRIRLADLQPTQWTIAAGDLNHDQKTDLIVLGTNHTYVILQDQNGVLKTPRPILNTSPKLGLAAIADLNGDGRNDFTYATRDGKDQMLCARLQKPDGNLGPEIRFELSNPRSVTLADIDGKAGSEILTIDSQTGRMRIQQLEKSSTQNGDLSKRLTMYGFGEEGSGRNRGFDLGDINGDGITDVVVSDPETAQMLVYLQAKDRGLDLGQTYPGLLGVEQLRVEDVNGDGRAEVFVLSEREKIIGVSSFENQRLSFPKILPVKGEPVAFEMADLDGNQSPELIYISRVDSNQYKLQALKLNPDGTWADYSFPSNPPNLENPKSLVKLDANGDGVFELMAFYGLSRSPKMITLTPKQTPQLITPSGGINLDEIKPESIFIGGPKRDWILTAQNNFARRLVLNSDNQWQVLDQFNAPESKARVVGAVNINLDGEPGDEIVLIDLGVQKLRILRKDANVYRPWKEVEIGEFPFLSAHVADLNGDQLPDLVLFGRGQFGILYSGQTPPTLKDVASYESKIPQAYFTDSVAGDLNSDGHSDVVILDLRTHQVEILNFQEQAGLKHALNFKVFEEKTFSRSNQSGSDPREAVIADLTGDNRKDLILLCHDRVLLYPQDDGKK